MEWSLLQISLESDYYRSTLNVDRKNVNEGMKRIALTSFELFNKVYLEKNFTMLVWTNHINSLNLRHKGTLMFHLSMPLVENVKKTSSLKPQKEITI